MRPKALQRRLQSSPLGPSPLAKAKKLSAKEKKHRQRGLVHVRPTGGSRARRLQPTWSNGRVLGLTAIPQSPGQSIWSVVRAVKGQVSCGGSPTSPLNEPQGRTFTTPAVAGPESGGRSQTVPTRIGGPRSAYGERPGYVGPSTPPADRSRPLRLNPQRVVQTHTRLSPGD